MIVPLGSKSDANLKISIVGCWQVVGSCWYCRKGDCIEHCSMLIEDELFHKLRKLFHILSGAWFRGAEESPYWLGELIKPNLE